jgi:membrane fusion protein
MSSAPLFRKDALEAQRPKFYGKIVLARPLSLSVLTLLGSGVALLIIALLMFGSYTRRSSVSGQLFPDAGVLKVYATQAGIILEKHAEEGQRYKKGQLLFVISSERHSSTQGNIQEAVSHQAALRERSLREELRQTRTLHQAEEFALRKKLHGLEIELTNVSHQLQGQRSRFELTEAALKRAEQLRAQGYFSAEMAQQKQADLLDQHNRLEALERDQINVERELSALRSEVHTLPVRQKTQESQIERLITSASQEWAESEGKRTIAVVAPESGVATGVSAEVGQTVDGNLPLLSMIPEGALLQAHLYAPSRAIGFIRPGDEVLLRYQAYPYEKFGHARGIVVSISRIALPPGELAGRATPAAAGSEPLYRITVHLASQTIAAYGKLQPLQAGMLVDADVLQEKRRLYEWILEPLFSRTGRL